MLSDDKRRRGGLNEEAGYVRRVTFDEVEAPTGKADRPTQPNHPLGELSLHPVVFRWVVMSDNSVFAFNLKQSEEQGM